MIFCFYGIFIAYTNLVHYYSTQSTTTTFSAEKNTDIAIIPDIQPPDEIIVAPNDTIQRPLPDTTEITQSITDPHTIDNIIVKPSHARQHAHNKNAKKHKKEIQTTQIIAPVTVDTSATSCTSPKSTVEKPKALVVNNQITEDMLSYKHWSRKKPYVPSFFEIRINDTIIPIGASLSFPLETKQLIISYKYVFLNGVRKGERTRTVDIPSNTTMVNLSFSWHDENHVLLNFE